MIGMSSLRKAGKGGMVMCMAPDVCKTQVGPAVVPIPYMIMSQLTFGIRTDTTVKMTDQEAFTMNSRLSKVVGDEPGALGGVVSNVNMGMCRPLTGNFTVHIGGFPMVQNIDKFGMNCAGPEGPPNTVGSVIFFDL